jgi:hypothetical protein
MYDMLELSNFLTTSNPFEKEVTAEVASSGYISSQFAFANLTVMWSSPSASAQIL